MYQLIDTILYGRKSYALWGQFTPTNDATEDEKEMWNIIHSKVKYVFSKSQTYPEENVHVISEDISKTVNLWIGLRFRKYIFYFAVNYIPHFLFIFSCVIRWRELSP